MANGINNLIGYGSAQVLPEGPSTNVLAQQFARQKENREQNERYNQQVKQRDERELYGLVGDALNLKDFNPVIHDKVKKAQIELAQKIKAENPSYADAYLAAQNAAATLGQLSQGLNQLDQQIALTKKEYEGDKRINSGNIEMIARKKILDQLNATGKVDPSINYFDEALNEYPQFALTDKSDYTLTDFLPEEGEDLSGKYKETNKAGRTDQFDWKTKNYPVYYDFKDNGEAKEPTISTRSQPSGFKDESGMDIPMLDDMAYGRFKAMPSNVVAINKRLQDRYGKDIDLKSEEAEKLRKIEAYKDVERMKPKVNKSVVEKAAPIRYTTNINMGGAGSPVNDIYGRIYGEVQRLKEYGEEKIKPTLLKGDEQKAIGEFLDNINKGKGEGEKITLGDTWVKLTDQDEVIVMGSDNKLLFTLPKLGTNLPKQANVKGKQSVVAQGEPDKSAKPQQTKPKKDPLGLF